MIQEDIEYYQSYERALVASAVATCARCEHIKEEFKWAAVIDFCPEHGPEMPVAPYKFVFAEFNLEADF